MTTVPITGTAEIPACTVTSVNGQTGDVVLEAGEVGTVEVVETPGAVIAAFPSGGVWPSRPIPPEGGTVLWVGGATAPPEMLPTDVWSQTDTTLNGQWSTGAIQLTGGITDPILGTGGWSSCRYTVIGDTVTAMFRIVFGTSSLSAGNGTYRIGLPMPVRSPLGETTMPMGLVSMLHAGTRMAGILVAATGNTLAIRTPPMGYVGSGDVVTHNAPWAWGAGDAIEGSITYETYPL